MAGAGAVSEAGAGTGAGPGSGAGAGTGAGAGSGVGAGAGTVLGSAAGPGAAAAAGQAGPGIKTGSQAASAPTQEEGEPVQDTMDNFDFPDIQDFINEQKGENGWNVSFQEGMKDLMAGHLFQVFEKFLGAIKNTLFAEIHNGGVLMGQIIILGIFGAVFTNFSSVFNGSQISETEMCIRDRSICITMRIIPPGRLQRFSASGKRP